MAFSYEKFLNTPFGNNCISNNIDTKVLFEILTFIDCSIDFNNLNTALTRLKIALSFAAKLYPSEIKKNLSERIKCIEILEQHYTQDWFLDSIVFTESLKDNSQNPLGDDQKKHPFYGALITDLGFPEDEKVRAKVFGQLIAFKAHQNTTKDEQSISTAGLIYVINSIRKAGDRNSTWFKLASKLVDINFTCSRNYLETQIQKCYELRLNPDFKEGHYSFIRKIKIIATILLQHSTNKPLLSSFIETEISHPPKPKHLKTFTLPNNLIDLDALSEDDKDIGIDISISFSTTAFSEPLSKEGQELVIKAIQYDTEYSNQFLPWRWEALNPTELAKLSDYLFKKAYSSSTTNDKKIAFLIALTLATGQDLAALMNFKLVKTLKCALKDSSANLIVLDELLWCHKTPHLNDQYTPSDIQLSALEFVGDKLWLPLPQLISDLMPYFFQNNNCNDLLCTLLELKTTEIKKEINTQFSEFRSDRRIRSSLSRCEKVLFDKALFVSGGDEFSALTIVGTSIHRPPAGLYYKSFKIDTLQKIYTNATQIIFGSEIYNDENR